MARATGADSTCVFSAPQPLPLGTWRPLTWTHPRLWCPQEEWALTSTAVLPGTSAFLCSLSTVASSSWGRRVSLEGGGQSTCRRSAARVCGCAAGVQGLGMVSDLQGSE